MTAMRTTASHRAVPPLCALLAAMRIFADDSSRPPEPRVAPTDGVVSSTYGPYVYDPSGNVIAIGSDGAAVSSYVYDPMSRLKSATVIYQGNPQTQAYEYDVYGNRTKAGLESHPVDATTNRLSSMNAQYDAAGNLTHWQPPGSVYVRTYDYDALNMITREKISTGANERSVVHIYTADDERHSSVDTFTDGTKQSRWTLRELDGKVLRVFTNDRGTWPWPRDFVYRDGPLLASISGTTTYHYSLDHLGTPRIATDGSAVEVSRRAHLPFGAELTSSATPPDGPLRFTGHERDSDLNNETSGALDYMHARYYSSNLGRFLSVDPGPESAYLEMPQSWNRYSYALNNPIRFIDPTGREVTCVPNPKEGEPPICGETIDVEGDEPRGAPLSPSDSLLWDQMVLEAERAAYDAQDPSNDEPSPCPAVPIAPPGVDLGANIAEAQTHRPPTYSQFRWFKRQVGPRGPWDYKRRGMQYEMFGNFNYGATGSAMGIPDAILKRAAGYYQPKKAQRRAWGDWYGGAPYGDDPADQVQIDLGIKYAKSGC